MGQTPATPQAVHTLHRYFITANLMRREVDKFLATHEAAELVPGSSVFPVFFSYLSLWYATLYTALDGWRQLGLFDTTVDTALSDGRLGTLQDFRNVTFHYRPSYLETRHMAFIRDPGSAEWVRDAHDSLGAALLRALKEVSK